MEKLLKQRYEEAEVEVIRLSAKDVIITSIGDDNTPEEVGL